MTTLLEMPLKSVLPHTLPDLLAKYPDAMMRVETDSIAQAAAMDEAQFWAIIVLFDWDQERPNAIMQPAVMALSVFSRTDICTFHDILNKKLYALDGRRFAENLGSNAYHKQAKQHFSVDDFLYSRCAVVANGRRFFDEVLENPEQIPKEFTFESLLYLPDSAWELKTGQDDLGYFPETWYETFSNSAEWGGIVPLKERILKAR